MDLGNMGLFFKTNDIISLSDVSYTNILYLYSVVVTLSSRHSFQTGQHPNFMKIQILSR